MVSYVHDVRAISSVSPRMIVDLGEWQSSIQGVGVKPDSFYNVCTEPDTGSVQIGEPDSRRGVENITLYIALRPHTHVCIYFSVIL